MFVYLDAFRETDAELHSAGGSQQQDPVVLQKIGDTAHDTDRRGQAGLEPTEVPLRGDQPVIGVLLQEANGLLRFFDGQ